jgi:hypothetical protein
MLTQCGLQEFYSINMSILRKFKKRMVMTLGGSSKMWKFQHRISKNSLDTSSILVLCLSVPIDYTKLQGHRDSLYMGANRRRPRLSNILGYIEFCLLALLAIICNFFAISVSHVWAEKSPFVLKDLKVQLLNS